MDRDVTLRTWVSYMSSALQYRPNQIDDSLITLQLNVFIRLRAQLASRFLRSFLPSPILQKRTSPVKKRQGVHRHWRRVWCWYVHAHEAYVCAFTNGFIGYELTSMLYHAGGKVYLAGRSEPNAQKAINGIKETSSDPSAMGQLEYLYLDLSDLSAIKASAEAFQSKESKLDMLWNNAGVSLAPVGSVSEQGHELMAATNSLGPYLFTKLLLPSIKVAARVAEAGDTRIVWTSSVVVDLSAPKGGLKIKNLVNAPNAPQTNYPNSRTGNWFLASEMVRELAPYGILSVTQNPGNLKTNLLRPAPTLLVISSYPLLYKAKMGAYTELWAGLSPELKMEHAGQYVIPWGRIHPSPRKDLLEALKSKDDGGTGRVAEYRAWCEESIAGYE